MPGQRTTTRVGIWSGVTGVDGTLGGSARITAGEPAERAPRVLEVERLSVRFGTVDVLRDLTFTVGGGSALAIIGPNGSGKTVLLRALLGAIPFHGIVRWAPGTRLGYVPQKLDLDRDIPMTGSDFLRARARLAREPDAGVTGVLDLVGLSPAIAGRPIGALSAGQFQRVLVAFALVGAPTVLLLDEPTAGVDEPGQEQLNELVHRFQHERGLTVLFTSHDLSVVYRYAEEVLCLGGTRPRIGPPREILTPDLLEEVYGMPLRYHVHEH